MKTISADELKERIISGREFAFIESVPRVNLQKPTFFLRFRSHWISWNSFLINWCQDLAPRSSSVMKAAGWPIRRQSGFYRSATIIWRFFKEASKSGRRQEMRFFLESTSRARPLVNSGNMNIQLHIYLQMSSKQKAMLVKSG